MAQKKPSQDYYHHSCSPARLKEEGERPGYDFRRGDGKVDTESNGTYSAVGETSYFIW